MNLLKLLMVFKVMSLPVFIRIGLSGFGNKIGFDFNKISLLGQW